MLQEAHVPSHVFRAFQHTLRSMDYYAVHDVNNHLVTVWRRGLNVANLAPLPSDAQFRVQRFALQLRGCSRLLVRHVHAPSGSLLRQSRRDLFTAFGNELAGSLLVTIGDCNEHAPACHGAVPCFPNALTLDGSLDFLLRWSLLASTARVSALAAVPVFQHRPVSVMLSACPTAEGCWKWFPQSPGSELPWTPEAWSRFCDLSSRNVDLAWSFWHTQAGGAVDHAACKPSSPHGAWNTGPEADAIFKLFKKLRRLHARRTAVGDRQAEAVSLQITDAIDRLSKARLAKWKADMYSRSTASSWLKRRLAKVDFRCLPSESWQTDPVFAPELAEHTAKSLAKRWNAGLSRLQSMSSWCNCRFKSQLPEWPLP